jgi:hypothetical protein
MSDHGGRAEPGGVTPKADLLVERLLRVIDEGRRTATYKLALLSGLMDAVALTSGSSLVPTRLIAEGVLALYYPQTRPYVANDGIERELRQISMKSSPVLRAVLRLRLAGDNAGCRSVDDARERVGDVYDEVLTEVETTFVRYPLPLLQVVGSRSCRSSTRSTGGKAPRLGRCERMGVIRSDCCLVLQTG